MEAIVGVWLTSILGAGAFSVAGYVAGQRGVSIPLLGVVAPPPPREPEPVTPPAPAVLTPTPTPVTSTPPPPTEATSTDTPSPPDVPAEGIKTPQAIPATAVLVDSTRRSSLESDDADVLAAIGAISEQSERPTIAPSHPPSAVPAVSYPPPLAPTKLADVDAMREEIAAAKLAAEQSSHRARAAEVLKSEIERQLDVVRGELKHEMLARGAADKRVEELGDRLASASEEASSLRHRVALLDKQVKQLREALQGRVRALTESELQRRRDLEEAEYIRTKLQDVYEKIERSSLPPSERQSIAASKPAATPFSAKSTPPAMPAVRDRLITTTSPGSPPMPTSIGASSRPGSLRPSIDEAAALREEVQRLTAENRSLRARALGSLAAPKPRHTDSVPDLDLGAYRELMTQLTTVAGLKSVAVTDEVGALLVGDGEDAEGLAAFGAYIRDASARTERLLPLEGVQEIDIRDRSGMLLATRVVAHAPLELSVVLLTSGDASLTAAKKIVDDVLRLR